MAAIPSSSSSRGSRNKHTDSFRPQFPVNPFGLLPKPSFASISSNLSEPWLLKPDQAPLLAAYRRDVVLVLGIPSERCVAALLDSHSLAHSLVIFASHSPPTLPLSHAPAVRILRLASPLAIEDTGAVRLVGTLEWAERVARIWRASVSDAPDVVRYDETAKDVPVTTPASGALSDSIESLGKKSCRSRKGLPSFVKRRLSASSTKSGPLSGGSLPPVDPSQRPFDAILNYLAHDVTERHVLKQIILATSITRPFLAPTLSPYHKLSEAKKHSRRKSNSFAYSLPPTPPYESGDLSTPLSSSMTAISTLSMPSPPSHMVHVVPPTARVGLVQSLDSFLASFSHQAVGTDDVDLAKQYILSSSTVRETIAHPHLDQDECTVLDLILLGGLDSVSGKSWIGSSRDILFLPTSGSSATPSTLTSRKSLLSPSRTPLDSSRSAGSVSPPRTRVQSTPQLLSLSAGGLPKRPRRSDSRISEIAVEQDGFDLSPRSEPLRRNHPLSLSSSSGRATRRSKLSMITQHDDPISSEKGLPTPPDSDEDARQVSPPPRASTIEVSTPQKWRLKWRFWKS